MFDINVSYSDGSHKFVKDITEAFFLNPDVKGCHASVICYGPKSKTPTTIPLFNSMKVVMSPEVYGITLDVFATYKNEDSEITHRVVQNAPLAVVRYDFNKCVIHNASWSNFGFTRHPRVLSSILIMLGDQPRKDLPNDK